MDPEADDDPPAPADPRALAREIGADPELEEVIGELQELGVPPAAIRAAHARGRVEDAIFDAILDPDRGERTVSASQIESRGGLTVAETQVLALTLGLRAPDPDEAYWTVEEAHVYERLGELREIWPPEVYLQVVRVYGRALAHIAQTEVHAFRLYVEPKLREATGGVRPALPAVQQAFGELLPLADPLLLGVHRRRMEHELAQAAVREAERRTPEAGLPGAVDVTLVFCDLKDFTAYADAHGDQSAVEAVEHFAAVVTAELGDSGHVLKALGDGFMLSYPEPSAAVGACARIIERMRGGDTPDVHASIHSGVALYREGDYFGSAVNLAGRLLGLAGGGELLVTEAVVTATDGRFEWEPLGARRIRGLSAPVETYRLVSVGEAD